MRPRQPVCFRGHPRTVKNSTTDGRCRVCRTMARAAKAAADTRPKDPVKVRAGLASKAAIAARNAKAARVVSVPAPLALDPLPPLGALSPRQLYQHERAKRVAAGKPVLRTLDERREVMP